MSILDGVQLFASLSSAEKSTLELFCQERELSSSEMLFHEGDDANAMYIVKLGSLVAFRQGDNGKNILGNITKDGFVGEMSLFGTGGKKRNASVEAIESSTLITLLDFSVKELADKHPEIMAKIKSCVELRNMENMGK